LEGNGIGIERHANWSKYCDRSWLSTHLLRLGFLGCLFLRSNAQYDGRNGARTICKHLFCNSDYPLLCATDFAKIIASCILFGYVVGPAIAITGSTIYLASLANSFGLAQAGSVVSECVITVAVSLFIGICAYRGVELSSKVSIVLGVICLPLAVGITIAAANSFGFDVRSELTTSGLTIHSLPRGVFVAMAFFAGFDCVAALASETANPKRDVARTLKWTVGLCGSAVVIGALLQAPALMANVNALDAGESPTKILANAAGFPSIALMSDVVLAMTTVSGLIAWFNAAAIIVATAANDGFLPRKLGVLDAKSGTPQRAIILLTLISTVLPTIIFAWTKSAPIIASLYMSNFIVLIWLIPYGLICAAAIWGTKSSSHPFAIRVSAVIGLIMILSTVVAQLVFCNRKFRRNAYRWTWYDFVFPHSTQNRNWKFKSDLILSFCSPDVLS